MQGWRKNMEDAHFCISNIGDDLGLFGIFDGHGGKTITSRFYVGQQVALFAKKHLPLLVKASPSYKAKNYKQALIDAFLGIDKRLETEEGKKELEAINATNPTKDPQIPQEPEMLSRYVGCTACVALITKNVIYVANSGDSRCVLSKGGIAINLSEDHKPDLERERKRIEKAEGFVEESRVNGALNLSRSLGDLEYKQNKKLPPEEQIITAYPDVRVEKITNDSEFLIMGCDGIWDCMSSQTAVDFVKEHASKQIAKHDKTFKLSKVLEAMLDKNLAADVESSGNWIFNKIS